MAFFEKMLMDRPDKELLEKQNLTQYQLNAKIGKKVVLNIDDLIQKDRMLNIMLQRLSISASDLHHPHFFEFLSFIKPTWVSLYNAYYGASLFLEQ
mmetsp:Transcript_47887/g.35103  ORF Transcript_47887/g.35103 Transcript_47887/m.35103 type:complete len:96 (+) Transcript_47887:109-396(+)